MTTAIATARDAITDSKVGHLFGDRTGTRTAVSTAVPIAALLLWGLLAVPVIHPTAMNDLGLISVLPVSYFIALGALVVSLALALHRPDYRPWVVGLHLVALFVILQATVPLVYPEPRYTWTYKHIGVVTNIETYHHLDRSVDIYQNFPGFFSLVAVLSHISGIGALKVARWAPFFFSGMNALAVRFILGALTTKRRQVQLALLVYLVTDWVGQNYFSPQAFAFPLYLVAVGLILRYGWRSTRASGRGRHRAEGGRWQVLARLRPHRPQEDSETAVAEVPYRWTYILVFVLAGVIVVSHPLTPIMLIAALAALVVLQRCAAWIVVAVAGMLVIQIVLSWHLLSFEFPGLFGAFGHVTDNASGVGAGIGSTDHAVVVWGTRMLSTSVWLLALAGALVAAFRGNVRQVAAPALLLLTPFVLVFGQSYGGEAIYRVYMFTLPWCAFLISELWFSTDISSGAVMTGVVERADRRRARRQLLATLAIGSTLVPLFVLTYFGLDRYAYVRPAAVQAASWFDRHSAPGSVLVGVVANYPDLIGPNYPLHNQVPCCYGITLAQNPAVDLRDPVETDLKTVVRSLQQYDVPSVYIVITPEEDAYAAILGEAPPGAVEQLGAMLAQSPAFHVVFERDGVTLVRLRPAPHGASLPQ